jgi:AcrR family transcriptional regulator
VADRIPLSPGRVVTAAARVADRSGLTGVSMRSVGRELGVEAMSLYHHVAGKEALLDALADWIFDQVSLPVVGQRWRTAMEDRARSVRDVLVSHPWGLGLIESRRSPGPATLRHHDAVLGCLRAAGFRVPLAASAFSVIDAYVYGFVLTEVNLPFQPGEAAEDYVEGLRLIAADHPHLVEMVTEQVMAGGYSYADEFEPGLALVLDGLEARLDAAPPR